MLPLVGKYTVRLLYVTDSGWDTTSAPDESKCEELLTTSFEVKDVVQKHTAAKRTEAIGGDGSNSSKTYAEIYEAAGITYDETAKTITVDTNRLNTFVKDSTNVDAVTALLESETSTTFAYKLKLTAPTLNSGENANPNTIARYSVHTNAG